MNQPWLERLLEIGCFVDPEVAAHVQRQADPDVYVRRILACFIEVPFHLSMPQVLSAESLLTEPTPPGAATPVAPRAVPRPTARASDHAADVEILMDASRAAAPAGDVHDFIRYFNDRYDTLAKLLRRRREVANAVPMNAPRRSGRELQFIGLVDEVSKHHQKGHRFLELEDNTGSATIMVPANRPELVAVVDTLLPDEVVGVASKVSKDGKILIAESIVRPDMPFRPEQREPLDVALHAAFLGDVHLGSKTFLPRSFRRMIRWLRAEDGTEGERSLAQSIKYVVLPGDIVDGVGVYPGQEDSLDIPDVLEQYRQLARELEVLPRHLHLVMLPGNHDASRPTEPQPAFDKEIRGYFDSLDATFVSNPSAFALHGRRVHAYHGFSMVDFTTHVPGLSLERPTEIMRQMLQCRHVAPMYGANTPIAPEDRDRLIIGVEPDIFATGHVHVAGIDRYRGVTLVNGGTWQAQTDYQKMHNLTPTPARMPVVNLSTLTGSMLDFPDVP